jgi:hypothetical protein
MFHDDEEFLYPEPPGFWDNSKVTNMRRTKRYKRASSMRRKKKGGAFSLTVRKGRKVWRMIRKFKSKASRDRAKRGLRSIGWR